MCGLWLWLWRTDVSQREMWGVDPETKIWGFVLEACLGPWLPRLGLQRNIDPVPNFQSERS